MTRKLLALLLVALLVVAVIFIGRGGSHDIDRGHILPADTVTTKTAKPVVRIFMENSGSMNGYVTTNSQFKNALGHLITKADGFYAGTRLDFINQDIHHTAMCDDLDNFVLQLNPQSMQVGNTGSTDINKIFKMILDHTSKDTVSVLVSDCMYDVDNVGSLLSAAANSTTGTFMKAIRKAKDAKKEFAAIIMQCMSEFSGNYYEGGTAIPCDTQRPYYVIVMGNLEQVMDFNRHMELEDTPTGLPGMTHKYMLSSESTWMLDPATARINSSTFTNALRIQAQHDGLNVRKLTVDKEQPNLNFAFGLGIEQLFADRSYLLDKDNYDIQPSQYKITDVNDNAKFTECDYFKHPITIQVVALGQQFAPQLTIRLKNVIPAWVKECSYNERIGALPPSNKSYALYEMVEGIYSAFYNNKEDDSRDIFKLDVRFDAYE
ncbi:MAG: hypothetical protein IKQ77_12515 [Prevotella sp.]|nr:hypothetical protein [Prevotella sp.]